jgi:MoxR-like ATPase
MPPTLLRRLEFFVAQFEFCEPAAVQLEYRTKDTAKLAGADWRRVLLLDSGKDKLKDLGLQTTGGLSVRSLMTVLVFVKAMAMFRGSREVGHEDLRQILPFVLHDKLQQNPDSPFFEVAGNAALRTDKIGWIRRLFDLACAEYDRLNLDRDDPVGELGSQFDEGLEGLTPREVRARLLRIERTLSGWSQSRKMYAHMFDDILKLKYLHQRYTNFLRWLEWKK